MASQLYHSRPLTMEPGADSFWGYDDPCLSSSDGINQLPLMFSDLWPLEAGGAYAAPLLYPVADDLSPSLTDEDMFDVAAPLSASLDPLAWQGGDALAAGPVSSVWPNGDGANGGFDMAPLPPQPDVAPFYADGPAWQAALRGGGYHASQRTTPPPRQAPHRHHHHSRQPALPASRPLAAASPAVKRSHSRTPLGPRKSPAAGPAAGDALPSALQGLVAMEQSLRSATHEQKRRLSATYEVWDRWKLSSAATSGC